MSDFQVEAQHVSTTEDEMTQAANIFAKMRDAVIDASHLAGEVAELRKAVAGFRQEMDALRRDNHYLTEVVSDLRTKRDALIEEAKTLRQERDSAEFNSSAWKSQAEIKDGRIEALTRELDASKKDRDDAEFKALELSEELEKVKAKLAKVMAVFSESETSPKAAEIARPAQAEPSHDPVPMSQASGDSPWPPRNW